MKHFFLDAFLYNSSELIFVRLSTNELEAAFFDML